MLLWVPGGRACTLCLSHMCSLSDMRGHPRVRLQAQHPSKLPPGAEQPAARRPECVPEAHGWTGRKKQRTADTADMQKAALSNACEQPAAILGMVPCPQTRMTCHWCASFNPPLHIAHRFLVPEPAYIIFHTAKHRCSCAGVGSCV